MKSFSAQENLAADMEELMGLEPNVVRFPGRASPLDRLLSYSMFASTGDTIAKSKTGSLREIAELVRRTTIDPAGREEAALAGPLLMPARFTGSRLEANMVDLCAVALDHDAGEIGPEEAARRLRAAGIAALVHTSRKHTAEAPRWRVIAPLAQPVAPSTRGDLIARLAAVLGVGFDSKATSALGFFIGAPTGKPRVIDLVDGDFCDRVLPPPASPVLAPELLGDDDDDDEAAMEAALVDARRFGRRADFEADLASGVLVSALKAIPPTERNYDTWLKTCMALHLASGAQNDGLELARRWSLRTPWAVKHGEQASTENLKREWRRWTRKDKPDGVGAGTIYAFAKAHGWTRPEPVKAPVVPARLNFLTPDQCSAERSRGYVVKGVFAPGDVGMIFGQPGAGKSLIAPYLGYMVAQGETAFGMRTKAGKVFYVAAEDPHGLKGRVRALRRCHGPADNFTLVDGVSDLLAPDSPDLAALEAAVEEQRPSLIFVDTLAMAFPGLEENDAAAMGHVVRVARDLAKWGAAVVLIHHPPKAGGTPRGHGLLNGALDVALSIERGEDGVIRGALTKNRNGTCDRDIAFTIAVEEDGVDEDGDRVTLPRAEPFDPRDLLDDLIPVERKALRALEGLIETAQKIDPIASAIPEADWKVACIAPGALSAAEDPDSRDRAFRKGRKGLAAKGRTSVDNGMVRINLLFPNELRESGPSGPRADQADNPSRHT